MKRASIIHYLVNHRHLLGLNRLIINLGMHKNVIFMLVMDDHDMFSRLTITCLTNLS